MDYFIHLCEHCGEITAGKYCPLCRTAEGRKKVDTENKKIMIENITKGFIY